jgi:hypothetical protein
MQTVLPSLAKPLLDLDLTRSGLATSARAATFGPFGRVGRVFFGWKGIPSHRFYDQNLGSPVGRRELFGARARSPSSFWLSPTWRAMELPRFVSQPHDSWGLNHDTLICCSMGWFTEGKFIGHYCYNMLQYWVFAVQIALESVLGRWELGCYYVIIGYRSTWFCRAQIDDGHWLKMTRTWHEMWRLAGSGYGNQKRWTSTTAQQGLPCVDHRFSIAFPDIPGLKLPGLVASCCSSCSVAPTPLWRSGSRYMAHGPWFSHPKLENWMIFQSSGREIPNNFSNWSFSRWSHRFWGRRSFLLQWRES